MLPPATGVQLGDGVCVCVCGGGIYRCGVGVCTVWTGGGVDVVQHHDVQPPPPPPPPVSVLPPATGVQLGDGEGKGGYT